MSILYKGLLVLFLFSEHQQNTRKESKEDKQTIEKLETDTDDLAETLCNSKIITSFCDIWLTNERMHAWIKEIKTSFYWQSN